MLESAAPVEQVLPRLLFDRAESLARPPAGRAARPARPAVMRTRRAGHHTVRHKVQHHRANRWNAAATVQHRLGTWTRRARGAAGAVIAFARDQVGDPYVFGADGPGSWDCSGLTMAAFARAGVRLPHRAAAQSTRGNAVSRARARAGDLVIWGGVGSAHHVGIYLGGGRVLHSPRPGEHVRVAALWGRPEFRRLL